MKKRLTAERRNEIAQLLLKNGNMKASSLAEHFGVSTETIRKDLIYLESQGIAQKSYGGAIASSELLLERPIAQKEMERMEIKTAIAERAAVMIPRNGVIFLDAGSTTYALARLLRLREDLTVFTNSIMVLNILSDSANQVYALGGRVRGSSKGIVGAWATQAISSLHFDLAFLGSDGFKDLSGPSCVSYEEAEVKQTVLKSSSQTVVLSDHTKFLSNSLFQFADWNQLTALVTDRREDPDIKSLAEKISQAVNVICV